MIERADLITLAFPLYIDSLPAPVIKAMELIKEERDRLEPKKSNNFIAIVNNGFPEASQNTTVLRICRVFAKECNFLWKGGIMLGGGGAIGGVALQERGGMVRNIVRGLDIAAGALKDDKDVPQEAIDLISKKIIPYSLYNIIGNLGWKSQAKKFNARKKLKDKPYSL